MRPNGRRGGRVQAGVRRAPAGLLLLALGLAACAAPVAPRPPAAASPVPVPRESGLPATGLPERQQARHVLDRLAYGPRPGEAEAVARRGLLAWIDAQLDPSRLDDADVERRLAGLAVPTMTPRELMEAYPLPQAFRQQGRVVPRERSPQALVGELRRARLLRAVYSERQLLEVMVDFWFNHFNVFAGKGTVRYYLPDYERTALRPHALGRFRDLLGAVAHHPAMLYYLDAWLSTAPGPRAGGRRTGLNENYARELLELHTLGVDGGYEQADVVAVARAFTGWTIDHPRPGHPRSGGGFLFDPRAHDAGPKRVLGQEIRAAGVEEGERVLDLLARHPATARHIARKLARRFVGDDPPPGLVDRAAAVFRERDGDIRAVVRAIVLSPEFFAPAAYCAKVRTPLEFVAAALRAVGAETDGGAPIQRTLGLMGEPLYGAQPPTGYADRAEAWTSPGGLLARLNFAQALAAGRLPGSRVALERLAPEDLEASGLADALVEQWLGGDVSAETRAVLREALAQPAVRRATLDDPLPAPDVATVAALVLGSPEFQRK